MTPEEGTTLGSIERGMPSRARSSSSQSIVWMLNSMVLLAFEGSVACTAPLVRFQMSQVSTVPNSKCPASASLLVFGILSRIQRSFVPEK